MVNFIFALILVIIFFAICGFFDYWEEHRLLIISLILLTSIPLTFVVKQFDDEINRNNAKLWNNGYCVECGEPYRFSNATYNSNTYSYNYFWTCDNCQTVIEHDPD